MPEAKSRRKAVTDEEPMARDGHQTGSGEAQKQPASSRKSYETGEVEAGADRPPTKGPAVYEMHPAKAQPKRRGKLSRLERYERRRQVSAMLAAGVDDKTIKAELAPRWGVKKQVVARVMREVTHEWTKQDRRREPYHRAAAQRRLHGHIAAAKSAKAWGAVASLERLLAEIQGTRQPEEVHVKVEAELRDSVAVVVAQLTPERLAELADAALEARQLAAPRPKQLQPPAPLVVDAETGTEG